MRVSSREPSAARREAIAAALPLFATEDVRSRASELLESAVFARARDFVGRQRLGARAVPTVEVLLDRLSAALQQAGLIQPPGYHLGREKVLIALGRPGDAPRLAETVAGDALRLALFARGIEARDLRDPYDPANKDAEHFRLSAETETVVGAARGGWEWVVTGESSTGVERDPRSRTSRAETRLDARLYELRFSSVPFSIAAGGAAVDVSTTSALARAAEQAGQEAAARVGTRIASLRAGRTVCICFLPGAKDPRRVRALLTALRAVPEVDGAALTSWNGAFEAMTVQAFVHGLSPDELAARLLHADPSLRVTGIDSELRQIFFETPDAEME